MRTTKDKKMKDKRRIRGGHRVGQRGQGTTAGLEEDKTRTQSPDTQPGHRVQGRGQPVWPALFSKRQPQCKLFLEQTQMTQHDTTRVVTVLQERHGTRTSHESLSSHFSLQLPLESSGYQCLQSARRIGVSWH